jgi:hypothetical protein
MRIARLHHHGSAARFHPHSVSNDDRSLGLIRRRVRGRRTSPSLAQAQISAVGLTAKIRGLDRSRGSNCLLASSVTASGALGDTAVEVRVNIVGRGGAACGATG